MILQSATSRSESIKVGAICPWYISDIQWSPVPQIAISAVTFHHDEERFLWRPSRRTALLNGPAGPEAASIMLAVDRKTDAVFGWLLYVTLHRSLHHGLCFWQDRHEPSSRETQRRSHEPRCMTPPSWSNRSMEYRVYASSQDHIRSYKYVFSQERCCTPVLQNTSTQQI